MRNLVIVKVFATITAVSLVVLISGCGGGAVKVDEPPKPLWETTRSVGAEGATIKTPDEYGAEVEVAPNTFSEPSDVTVQVFAPQAFKTPEGSEAFSYFVTLKLPKDRMLNDGEIRVQIPGLRSRSSEDSGLLCALVQIQGGKWLVAEADTEGTESSLSVRMDKTLIDQSTNGSGTRSSTVAILIVLLLASSLDSDPSVTFYKWEGQRWGDPERLPSNWEGKKIALVLHGILSKIDKGIGQSIRGRGDVSDLAHNIYQTNFYDEIWGVEYNWAAHIGGNGILLAERLAQVPGIDKANLIDIHAHSMGGLVARYALEESGIELPVFRLFTYGTPHQGAHTRVLLNAVLEAIDRLWDIDGVRDLLQGSSFIQHLNSNSSGRSSANYILFAGFVEPPVWPLFKMHDPWFGRIGTDGVVSIWSADPLSADPRQNSQIDESGASVIRTNCSLYVSGGNGGPLTGYNHSAIKAPKNLAVFVNGQIR